MGPGVYAIQQRAKGEGVWAENQKPSPCSSVFVNNVQRGLDLDSGGSIGGGKPVWVLGPPNQAVCEGGGDCWSQNPDQATGARLWPMTGGGPLYQVEGTWVGSGRCS